RQADRCPGRSYPVYMIRRSFPLSSEISEAPTACKANLLSNSVSNGPGRMLFTVIPCSASGSETLFNQKK
ncbi:MAG: hypothetical protein ABFR75_14180, partial [Acidobacteriota bacterium]